MFGVLCAKLAAAISKLAEPQEGAVRLQGELVYTCKCKKTMATGVPLSLEAGIGLLQRVKDTIEDIQSDIRVCKAHTPKGTKQ